MAAAGEIGSRQKLVVNYAGWPAVGHMLEALALAYGYKRANPDADVEIVVNEQTTVELAQACPWLAAVHTVAVPDPGPIDRASILPGVPFDPTPCLRLELPDDARATAETLVSGGTEIAVKPAGGGAASTYPSIESWTRILEALADRYPDLTVHLIGKLAKEGHPDTTAVTRGDIDLLLERHPFCRDRFDIGLFNQFAVIERCSVLISPHTGFAFGALTVGTPWLTISDGRWPEFFHTGTPFYSMLPEQVGDMSDERIAAALPELLHAADALIEGRWSFWRCYHRHERRRARLYGTRRERAETAARRAAHPLSRYANRPSLRALLR